MVPSKQQWALRISFICAHIFALLIRDEERCVCSEASFWISSEGPVFSWCLFNVSIAYSTSMLEWPLVGGTKGVRPTLFVLGNVRSARKWRRTFGGNAVSGWLLARKIWYMLFEDAKYPVSMKQGTFSHVLWMYWMPVKGDTWLFETVHSGTFGPTAYDGGRGWNEFQLRSVWGSRGTTAYHSGSYWGPRPWVQFPSRRVQGLMS